MPLDQEEQGTLSWQRNDVYVRVTLTSQMLRCQCRGARREGAWKGPGGMRGMRTGRREAELSTFSTFSTWAGFMTDLRVFFE